MSEKRQYSAKRIFGNLLWALLGFATVVLLGAAMNLRNNKLCKGVHIAIRGSQNNFFINKTEISNVLEKLCNGGLPGKTLDSFNLALIENTLKKNQWIKNAELFFDNNEVLKVDVIEREPVARIFTTTGSSFYLDTALAILPLSDKSSARVPVFSNFPAPMKIITKNDSNLLIDIKKISNYIINDPFWMAQIDQVDITSDRTFVMIPKIGNQVIVFGSADNYQQKFDHLLAFYKKVATKVGWNTYSIINVQYKDQVVAVKRGTEDVILDLLKTKQIMQTIVSNAQKQSNDSLNNIQLVQTPDDNAIPIASNQPSIIDETSIRGKENVLEEAPLKKVTVLNEQTNSGPARSIISKNKIYLPAEKSTRQISKKTTTDELKSKTIGHPYPVKNNIVVKSTSNNKKSISKSSIQSNIKPKAVMPPKNDY